MTGVVHAHGCHDLLHRKERSLQKHLGRFQAKAREPERILLRISAADFGPQLVDELKSLFQSFAGDCEVVLEMSTREGTRRLRFGREYCVAPSAALRAELDHLLGPRALAA